MNRIPRACLILAAAAVAAITALRVSTCWRTDAYLDHVAGVWFALADDLRHGVFYRPVYGPLGYGGTRYAPIVFVLLAGLMNVARDPRMAGYTLSFLSAVLLLGGVYALMRSLSVDRLLSACCTILVLAPQTGQQILFTVRGDALPAALVVSSLVICSVLPDRWMAIVAAALLDTLAFAAKLTSLYAAGVVFLFLLFSGRRRRAIQFLILIVIGVFSACALVYFASDGRVFEVIRMSAAGGGNWTDFVRAPVNMAYFMSVDLATLPFFVLAVGALFAWPRNVFRELAPLFFLTAVGATLVIYGSPGTDINHLLDVQVAAVILTAVWISRSEKGPALFAIQALAMAGLLSLSPAWLAFRRRDVVPERQRVEFTLHMLGPHPGIILSENPLFPILAHQEPYVLDPFAIRAISEGNPSFADPLRRMLEERKFSVVLLEKYPFTDYGRWWYSTVHFGDGFVDLLAKDYRPILRISGDPVEHTQGETVLVPRRPPQEP